MNADKFVSKKGEVKSSMPQCKNCTNSKIENGLSCIIYNSIPLKVRMNEVKCESFNEKEAKKIEKTTKNEK